MERYARLRDYYVAINLDMVGGSEDRANSTIMIIRTPLSRFSVISGILEYFICLANSKGESFGGSALPKMKSKAYPYELGSDHDVFNLFGVPSVMPITWPDRFYEEPLPEGPSKGAVLSRDVMERLLDEYYELRGWDKRTSFATREKLVELGLNDVADELLELGKL